MDDKRRIALTRDYDAFVLEMRAIGPRIDLEPGIAEYVELVRETSFRSGWGAGRTWQEHLYAEAPTVRCTVPSTARALVDVGDRAWVQPLAIIEHIGSGELFLDPRFAISQKPSDRSCIELFVTPEGIIALGPADRHRLSAEVDRARLRPLIRFEALTVG